MTLIKLITVHNRYLQLQRQRQYLPVNTRNAVARKIVWYWHVCIPFLKKHSTHQRALPSAVSTMLLDTVLLCCWCLHSVSGIQCALSGCMVKLSYMFPLFSPLVFTLTVNTNKSPGSDLNLNATVCTEAVSHQASGSLMTPFPWINSRCIDFTELKFHERIY